MTDHKDSVAKHQYKINKISAIKINNELHVDRIIMNKNKIIPNVHTILYIYMYITFGIVTACYYLSKIVISNMLYEARFGKLEKNDTPHKLKFYTTRKKSYSFVCILK